MNCKVTIFNSQSSNKPSTAVPTPYHASQLLYIASMTGIYETNKDTHRCYEQFRLLNGGDLMQTIYDELLERVADGEKFHIDFEKRNMRVGKKYLIKNGEYDEERKLELAPHYADTNVILHILKDLYKNYKYSMPSERSESKRRKYFKALSVDELTDEQLVNGEPRELACAKLEGYILCKIVDESFEWNDKLGKWFYQDKDDTDFVLLKKWFVK